MSIVDIAILAAAVPAAAYAVGYGFGCWARTRRDPARYDFSSIDENEW